MGTDAFGFLEYRQPGEMMWHGERLELWEIRHYKLFDAIAGGRSGRLEALIPPRGFPQDCSPELMQRHFFVVCTEAEKLRRLNELPRGAMKTVMDPADIPDDYTVFAIPNGDRYAAWDGNFDGRNGGNPTWLETAELQACFDHIDSATLRPEWHDLLAKMRTIEQEGGQTRLVIWFTEW